MRFGSAILRFFPLLLSKKEADMPRQMVREGCALCGGDGLDKTGKAVNGMTGDRPTPFCVRCGGYGTIPPGTPNPKEITRDEMLRIESQVLQSEIRKVKDEGLRK
jgi:hypothetical protein